jgi:hypothetical protein
METQNDTSKPATEPTPKAQKTASIGLTAGKTRLTLLAVRRADGTATTTVSTREKDAKHSVRGMTERHANMDAAKAAIVVLATQAEKLGWLRPERRAFATKPDAFATLPAAPKGKGKQEKK